MAWTGLRELSEHHRRRTGCTIYGKLDVELSRYAKPIVVQIVAREVDVCGWNDKLWIINLYVPWDNQLEIIFIQSRSNVHQIRLVVVQMLVHQQIVQCPRWGNIFKPAIAKFIYGSLVSFKTICTRGIAVNGFLSWYGNLRDNRLLHHPILELQVHHIFATDRLGTRQYANLKVAL